VIFSQRGDAIVVSEVQAGSQAAATGLIHAGDVLKRTSAVFGDELWPASDFRRTMCVAAAPSHRATAAGTAQCATFIHFFGCAVITALGSHAPPLLPLPRQVRHPAAPRRRCLLRAGAAAARHRGAARAARGAAL
jgi:hypothetical protein